MKQATPEIKERLECIRQELRAERISMGELVELQSLAAYIEPDDVELLEPAGVPEPETERKFFFVPEVALGETEKTDAMKCADRGSVFAKRALLAAFGDDWKENGMETTITDLLADLRHLCDKLGLDYHELEGNSYESYVEDKREDGTLGQ